MPTKPNYVYKVSLFMRRGRKAARPHRKGQGFSNLSFSKEQAVVNKERAKACKCHFEQSVDV
jgi:hypothetical protein